MKKNSNRGIALVSVMVIATVCMLIATIVLEITYTSLMSRKVYKAANDNNYSAEAAVDDMEAVLQSIAVYSVNQNKADVSKGFIYFAEKTLLDASGAASLSDNEKIADYLYSQLDPSYKELFKDKSQEGTVRDPNKFDVTAVKRTQIKSNGEASALAITVNFAYENNKGFLSNISTDLVLNDVTKRKTASDYSMGSYSMFNGGGVTITGNDSIANTKNVNGAAIHIQNVFKQEGNVYIGTMADEAPLALTIDNAVTDFSGALIVNGDVRITNNGVMCLTAGKDDGGSRTEVTINGTVYIDSTSALVISQDINFECQDIVLTNGSAESSIYNGAASYTKYNGTSTYQNMFPFEAKTSDEIRNGSSVVKPLNNEFVNGTVGGCVLISDGNKAYVAQCVNTGTKREWKLLGNGAPSSHTALINLNPLRIAEAKTTIRTYDNKEVVVDPELANFVNCQLLYFQGRTLGNDAMIYNAAKMIKQGSARSIVKDDVDLGLGGSIAQQFSSVDGLTTTELLSDINYSGSDHFDLSPISVNGQVYSSVKLKVGKSTDAAQNVAISDPSIMFACLWDTYTVQCNGGYYVGVFISADKCEYKPMGQGYSIGFSIIEAMSDSSNAASAQLVQMIDDLQYVTFIRDSGLQRANNYFNIGGVDLYDVGYRICMLDNLFKGGMKSFSASAGSNAGGSVTVETNSMYDFITVENWQQNN